MRILHVIPQFPYFGGRTVVGGYACSLLNLAWGQAQRGDQPTICGYIENRLGEVDVDGFATAYSLFEDAKPGTIGFAWRLIRAASKWAKQRRDCYDVVHCHSGFCDYLLLAWALKRATGLPTVHTMYCPVPPSGRVHKPGLKQALRAAAKRVDARVGISRNVAESMRWYGMSEPIEVIDPPLDLQRFSPTGPASRNTLGLSEEDLVVLFVGNAKRQKNLDTVFQAFRPVSDEFPEAKLVVTTELPASSSDTRLTELARLAEDLGIASRIAQLRIVPDMPGLMRAADVLVAPFLDSYGPSDYFMVALEGMACGKPVIVSNVGGMPEVVDDDVGRLVDPRKTEQLSSALAEVLSDVNLRRRLGQTARMRMEKRFDVAAVADRYARLYQKIGDR